MKIVIDLDDDTWVKVLDGYVPLGISKQLKAGIPLDKFLEDIKQEIEKEIQEENHGVASDATYEDGLEGALEIIDKHIGKEQE